MFDLRNKKALITGASSGIGLAVARRFTRAGAQVIVADLHDSPERQALACTFRKLDVADPGAVEAVFADIHREFGAIDVLINNAGIALAENSLTECVEGDFHRILQVNLYGVLHGLKFGPGIMRDGGNIINTASLAADVTISGMAAYGVSKSAVIKLTTQAALELGERRIRVNAVCPGTTTTPMEPSDSDESVICSYASITGRPASADEQAAVYHFLACDDAAYINAQAIRVDGGWINGLTDRAVEKLLS